MSMTVHADGTLGFSGVLSYHKYDNYVEIFECFNSVEGELIIPDEIEGLPVTSIGEGAFTFCQNLTAVTIPNSVTSIGNMAFAFCSELTSITIPNGITNMGDLAFTDCTKLSSLIIMDGVTSIGGGTFDGCTSLTSVIIPNSVTSIEYGVFANCENLTHVTIPSSVTSIGISAFSNCESLTDVYYSDTEEEWNAIEIAENNDVLFNTTIHYNSSGNSSQIVGDCNNDGVFSVADVVLLQKWLLAVPDMHLADWKAADLCEDSVLDVFDLCLMKRELVSASMQVNPA